MNNQSQKHWIVVICACALAAASLGFQLNASGVYITPVSESLNIGRGTFSMNMTCFMLMTAVGALIAPKLMAKIRYKALLIIAVAIDVIATMAMGWVSTPMMFNILGIIRGLSASMFYSVPLTMIINNWFVKNHGLATSIVFSFSGIAGAIASPILTAIISVVGWRTTYLINAIIVLLLCLPAILYPWHLNPRKDGLLPYGYEGEIETSTSQGEANASLVSIAFLAMFGLSLLIAGMTSVTQHFPGYATSINAESIGALLLSAAMIGNIVFKFLLGTLSDHIGPLKATFLIIIINAIGILLLILRPSRMILMIGAFCYGSCYAFGSVGLPLITKAFFGDNNYNKVFPPINLASNIGASLILSVVGFAYDLFHTYIVSLIMALLMLALVTFLLIVAYRSSALDNNTEI